MTFSYLSKGTMIELIDGRWYAPAVVKDYTNTPELSGSYGKETETKKEAFLRIFFQETAVEVDVGHCHEICTDFKTTFFLGIDGRRMKGRDMMPIGKEEWLSGIQGELVLASLYEVSDLLKWIKPKEKNPFIEIMFRKAELDPEFSEYLFAKAGLKSAVAEYLFEKAGRDSEFVKRLTDFANKSPDFYMDNMKRIDAFLVNQ